MTVSQTIAAGRERLARAGLECADPLLHMKQIVEAALGIDAARAVVRADEELAPAEAAAIETFLGRRLTGEPFQYILGAEWFWDSKFRVGPGVLIPRPETEVLVEALLEREARPKVRIAELGAGSGCIGIAALGERPGWEWHAFESNPASIAYAEENRRALLPADARYHLYAEDFFAGARRFAPCDWVVTNPPYVPSSEWSSLSKEVRHEPRQALDGGNEGLEVMKRLVPLCAGLLGDGGGFLTELDSRQSGAVSGLLANNGFGRIEVRRDYAGLDRVVFGFKGR